VVDVGAASEITYGVEEGLSGAFVALQINNSLFRAHVTRPEPALAGIGQLKVKDLFPNRRHSPEPNFL
jgi:hypothetical protein